MRASPDPTAAADHHGSRRRRAGGLRRAGPGPEQPPVVDDPTDAAGSAAATAFRYLLLGDLGNARRAIERGGPELEGQAPGTSLRAIAPLVKAMAGVGGIEAMTANGLAALSLTAQPGPLRATCLLACGTASYVAGDRASARGYLEDALDESARTPHTIRGLAQTQLALLEIGAGDWDLAQHRLSVACESGAPSHGGSSRYAVLTWATSSLVTSQARIPDRARALAERSRRAVGSLDEHLPWLDVETRIVLARAYIRLHEAPRARSLLDEASRASRAARLGPGVLERVDRAWHELEERALRSLEGAGSLTTAELRILRFLPSHLSFWEIGERLNVSGNTVKTQARAAYGKLGAKSRSEAVARAAALGLVEPVIV